MKHETSPKPSTPSFNDSESPLYRLYCRKDRRGNSTITAHQFAAGERLRMDYEYANFERRITVSLDGAAASSGHASISDNYVANLSDNAIDARRRVHEAFDAVGPELSGVLYYICCLAGGLEQAERMLQLPQRSGKAVLALALTRLARHYRLLKTPTSSDPLNRISHWALADYRPHIMQASPGAHQT
jgi:Domain of unknown function (DUF6456)